MAEPCPATHSGGTERPSRPSDDGAPDRPGLRTAPALNRRPSAPQRPSGDRRTEPATAGGTQFRCELQPYESLRVSLLEKVLE